WAEAAPDDGVGGIWSMRVPDLLAVEHDFTAVVAGAGAQVGQGATRLWLAHARCHEGFTCEKLGQHLLLDTIRAELGDLTDGSEIRGLKGVPGVGAHFGNCHHDENGIEE